MTLVNAPQVRPEKVDVGNQDSEAVGEIRRLGVGAHHVGDQHFVVTESGKVLLD